MMIVEKYIVRERREFGGEFSYQVTVVELLGGRRAYVREHLRPRGGFAASSGWSGTGEQVLLVAIQGSTDDALDAMEAVRRHCVLEGDDREVESSPRWTVPIAEALITSHGIQQR
jgi:hypothetical protein